MENLTIDCQNYHAIETLEQGLWSALALKRPGESLLAGLTQSVVIGWLTAEREVAGLILGAGPILRVLTASYPDVSLSMKMCAQRKAGRRQRGRRRFAHRLYPSHRPLRFITSRSALLCEQRRAWGGGWGLCITEKWRSWYCLALQMARPLRGLDDHIKCRSHASPVWDIQMVSSINTSMLNRPCNGFRRHLDE